MLGLAAAGGSAPGAEPGADGQDKRPFLGGFLRETRIVYPLRIGDWSAAGEKRYDRPEEGVSVRYVHGDGGQQWIDAFFYPVGVLAQADVAELAERERAGLVSTWLQGPEASPGDISALGTLSLPRAPAPPGPATGVAGASSAGPIAAYSLDLTYVRGADRRNSAMVVLFKQLYVVKTRASASHELVSRAGLRRQLEDFTASLAASAEISSSGECWRPLPVERLDAGVAPPPGARMALSIDGAETDFIYADRVVSRDPEGVSAAVARRLAMAQQERLFEGCDGAGPTNPVVPGDMREIRIEYRAPGTDASPPRTLHLQRRATG